MITGDPLSGYYRVVPLALRIIAWLSLIMACWLLLLVGAALLDRGTSGPGYPMGGQQVPRSAWLQTAGPVMVLAAGWAGGLGVGLLRRRRWARHCAPALFASVGILAAVAGFRGLIPAEMAWRALAETIIFGLAAGWFFYRKREVVAYFRALP